MSFKRVNCFSLLAGGRERKKERGAGDSAKLKPPERGEEGRKGVTAQ